MSVLFERDRSVISKHIKNIFLEGEILEDSVCAFFAHTANDGKEYNVKYYNIDVVISVGYIVNLKRVQSFTNVQKMHIGNLFNQQELQFRCKKIQCNYLC